MDVVIQRQLGQCALQELIQIAIFLIHEIEHRLRNQSDKSESSSERIIVSDSDDDL